ncbi:MAG TPA: serine hydrolase domain-containing protein [Gemmatimonadales bacterium]|nr:serine hydrolase domain-containing protein [Gemmatimonadales bacterium]
MRLRLLLPAFLATLVTPLAAQRPDAARVRAATDSIVGAALATGRAAGMAVAVVRGRDTLVLQGYGKADLEWDVPMPADAIFEIGSVTKQFTAVAVLQLAEAGKLSLDDDITRHFPDYPLQGHPVTIRRLFDHTSGIASYTSLKEFDDISVRTLSRDTLVALFRAKPFDFAPGEEASYNNSGYFLLGLLVEKASGLSYADYVKQRLFEPAGMTDARYCDEQAVVARRANGYDPAPTGLVRAGFLVHTWPYAAGSLCATVGDLVAWNRALHGGTLLAAASYRELVTPGVLDDGTPLRYAKGLAVDSLHGRAARHHGGDINGFASELRWFPDDSVTIAVLINSQGRVRPHAIADAIGDVLFGKVTPKAARWRGRPADYAGTYVGKDTTGLSVKIAVDSAGTGLVAAMGPPPGARLVPIGGERFEVIGSPYGAMRLTFKRVGGQVTALRFDPVYHNRTLTRKPPKPAADSTATGR